MSIETKLKVTEIQRFCMHDGPGVRTTVFLKGCPMQCAWCHNPEAQNQASELLLYPSKCIGCGCCESACKTGAHTPGGACHLLDRSKCNTCFACVAHCPTGALEVCGRDLSVREILDVVKRDLAFYGTRGGMTLSGGEPFLQGNAVIHLLRACKEQGIPTAVETCGYADPEILREALPFVDLFLWDLKDTDDVRHKHYTGVSNRRILENLELISSLGARIRLRCILVNGVNTKQAHYEGIAKIANRIASLDGVEFIPYHAYGGTKAVFVGRTDNGRADWIPTEEQIRCAKVCLQSRNVNVF